MKYLIIGNGRAGSACARTIHETDKNARITLITNEKEQPYNKIPLSKQCMDLPPLEELILEQQDYVHFVFDKAMEFCPLERKVRTLKGIYPYDKLGIATGAQAFNPFPFGQTLHTYSEAKQFSDSVNKGDRVVIAGGGILGLESAVSLKKHGCEVTVIERANTILNQSATPFAAELLKANLSKIGIKILEGTEIKEVQENYVFAGSFIPYDHFLVSVGIKPDIQLAKPILNTRKGILVNEKMETSMPEIYAFGDCAEFEGCVPGLFPVAQMQGKTAGLNMCGMNATYTPPLTPVLFRFDQFSLYSVGKIKTNDASAYYDKEKQTYKELFFENDRCVGALFIGELPKNINELLNQPASACKRTIFQDA